MIRLETKRVRNFVVGTHGGLYQFSLNGDFEIENGRLLDEGYHYGLSVDADQDSDSAAVFSYRGGPGRQNVLPREIHVWNFDGSSMEMGEKIPLHENAADIHQISGHGRNGMLITNSHLNSIDRWDTKKGFLDRIHINDYQTDINHINSVLPVDDLVAVMLHNFRKLESQIVLLEDSGSSLTELGRFSLKDYCCHNIGIIDHWLYINASSDQSIVKIDLRTLKEVKRTGFEAHTKGLCSDGEYLFAGMSDCASRAERVRSRGWVNVLDPESLELIKSVSLSVPERDTAVGNVNEVRLLDGSDIFDRPHGVNVEALRNSVNVDQNQVAIACRRAWIRTVDRIRRTVGTVLAK